MPGEADYNAADGMFKNGAPGAAPAADASLAPSQTPPPTGVAASIINGDWTAGAYADLFGDKLHICPIPQVAGADWPKPLRGGHIPHVLEGARATSRPSKPPSSTSRTYVTDTAQQLEMVAR